ncbi:MAG TPA: MarR family winged helix-turn-helix transcriptional regulator [Verrucomicrobiae bacterium]|nr:MarR family winged helix-turn-helix transcriptional regulator [Verrucomicrobiae bacterium]
MARSQKDSQVKTGEMLIGALLRVPSQAIHRRIIAGLNAAGFEELRVPHMAVLQFPGPDGIRPSTLAERAGISKQAMNQLLQSLEGFGYIVRSDAPDEGRARIVRFTKRGRAAYARVHDILRDIEHEWSVELGPKDFAQLKELLSRVWESPLICQTAAWHPGYANSTVPGSRVRRTMERDRAAVAAGATR